MEIGKFMNFCANCEYWTGNRKFNICGGSVTNVSVENGAKGQCICRGGFCGQMRDYNSTCSSFTKHSSIK